MTRPRLDKYGYNCIGKHIGMVIFVCGPLFVGAGTLNWDWAWVFTFVTLAGWTILSLVLARESRTAQPARSAHENTGWYQTVGLGDHECLCRSVDCDTPDRRSRLSTYLEYTSIRWRQACRHYCTRSQFCSPDVGDGCQPLFRGDCAHPDEPGAPGDCFRALPLYPASRLRRCGFAVHRCSISPRNRCRVDTGAAGNVVVCMPHWIGGSYAQGRTAGLCRFCATHALPADSWYMVTCMRTIVRLVTPPSQMFDPKRCRSRLLDHQVVPHG